MKTKYLINYLSKREQQEFQTVLKGRDKNSLIIFEALQENDTFDKPRLFSDLFGEPYHAAKDGKFRNAVRKLNNELKSFLAQKEFEKNLRGEGSIYTLWLLKSLLSRKAFTLFESEWEKAMNLAQKKAQYSLIHQLVSLRFEYFVYEFRIDLGFLEKMEKRLSVGLTNNYLQYLEAEKELLRGHHFLQLAISAMKRAKPALGNPFDPTSVKLPKLFEFYNCFIQSYSHAGDEKIKILQQALSFFPELARLRPKIKKYEIIITASIGMVYFRRRQFEEAAPHLETALNLLRINKSFFLNNDPYSFCGIVLNNISNVLNLDGYEEAIQLYFEFEKELKANQNFRYRSQLLICLAFIFLNKPLEAYQLISTDLNNREKYGEHSARLVLVILQYLRGEENLYLHGIDALKKVIKNDPISNADYIEIVNLYHQFFHKVIGKINNNKRQNKVASLKKKSSALLNKSYLFSKWLLRELEQY